MLYYVIKIVITTLLIVVISEISKRSSFAGAILASIPLVSVLAMIWLYIDTKDTEKVSLLANNIFWLVLPSLTLFLSLPIFLKHGLNFYISMSLSVVITVLAYGMLLIFLKRFGIAL